MARQMGLPIKRLFVATNENDVLNQFFQTGIYHPRPETLATSSPSMDISKASNLERFVFDVVGRDPQKLAELWRKVENGEGFDLSHSEFFGKMAGEYGFGSGRSGHADRIEHIRKIKQQYGVVIDPHTADGMKVALENRDVSVRHWYWKRRCRQSLKKPWWKRWEKNLVAPQGWKTWKVCRSALK